MNTITIFNDTEGVTLTDAPFHLLSEINFSALAAVHTFGDTSDDGQLYISTKYDKRDVNIEAMFDCYGRDNDWINSQKQLLYRICNPKNTVTITINNGTDVYFIQGHPVSFPTFDNRKNASYQRFLMQFTCSDPYLYKNEEIVTFATVTPMFKFPLRINNTKMGEKQNTLIQNIYNDGMMDCAIQITMKANGTVTNPYLINLNTYEQIKLNTTLNNGDIVIINTGRQKEISLIRNGVKTNLFYALDLSSAFLQLHVGDNPYRFGSDAGSDYLEIEIAYNIRLGGL